MTACLVDEFGLAFKLKRYLGPIHLPSFYPYGKLLLDNRATVRFPKQLMLGKTENKRRGWQRIIWLESITDSMDIL